MLRKKGTGLLGMLSLGLGRKEKGRGDPFLSFSTTTTMNLLSHSRPRLLIPFSYVKGFIRLAI